MVTLYVVQSLRSWTVVLSHHITRYSHSLIQIHIGPQNSRRWPLCKSANVDIAAENIAETYWQEIPVWRLLWHWRPPRTTEIYDHVALLSSDERERNRMVRIDWIQWKWWMLNQTKLIFPLAKILQDFSPPVNNTDRATAACQRS
jgi:hypothetical protein